MKPSTLWKAGAGLSLAGLLGVVGAIAVLNHGQAQRLDLASTRSPLPASSPSPDDPLALACRQPAIPNNPTTGVSGLWAIQPGSVAGYRAREKFAELTSPHEAVARTDRLGGWILVGVAGGSIQLQTGCIAIDVRALRSVDELPGLNTADRDKTATDMLSAHSHPFAFFEPYPATISVDPSSTAVQHVAISGDVQISGVTRRAEFSLDVQLTSNRLAAAGSTTVAVGDFGVQVPQEAGGFVQVDPRITLEVSLILVKPQSHQ